MDKYCTYLDMNGILNILDIFELESNIKNTKVHLDY
jgi:hypothetical protein